MVSLSGNLFAQKTVDLESVCEPEKKEYDFSAKPVDSFKESLTIKLDITKSFDAYKTYNKNVEYTETFENETSIIEIGAKIAIQVSIARVEIRGEKYYLSAVTFYLKKGKCWEPMSENPSWSKLTLGSKTSSMSYNGVGYEGGITIY